MRCGAVIKQVSSIALNASRVLVLTVRAGREFRRLTEQEVKCFRP